MANENLSKAKNAKNDEFYTQYADIQAEVNAYLEYNPDVFRGKTILLPCDDPEWSNFTLFFAQNFSRFGLKRLISTSFAAESKNFKQLWQPSLFETESPQFDRGKTAVKGKIFTIDHDLNKDGKIDHRDLEWHYLEGDGDFRSAEVRKLRDEADVIITNPPFSLFREFLAWIMGTDKGGTGSGSHGGTETRSGKRRGVEKKFLIIGNMNALKYKETFPLIKNNLMWLGATGFSSDMVFAVPKGTVVPTAYRLKVEKLGYFGDYTRLGNSCWYTNLMHGRRRRPIELMTEKDNIKFSKHKDIRDVGYARYVNYNAIEVSHTDAIPAGFDGIMGVPISFLDKYCPEQFEIVGSSPQLANPIENYVEFDAQYEKGGPACYLRIGPKTYRRLYDRIFIRFKKTRKA